MRNKILIAGFLLALILVIKFEIKPVEKVERPVGAATVATAGIAFIVDAQTNEELKAQDDFFKFLYLNSFNKLINGNLILIKDDSFVVKMIVVIPPDSPFRKTLLDSLPGALSGEIIYAPEVSTDLVSDVKTYAKSLGISSLDIVNKSSQKLETTKTQFNAI